MREKSKEKNLFKDGVELMLKGTPEMALALIAQVAQEFTYQGKKYSFDYDAECSTATFIEGTIWIEDTVTIPTAKKGWAPISVIELYLLPGNKTRFRIPPRKHWGIPEKLSIDPDHSFLRCLLARLFTEFQRLGHVEFKEEKPLLGFRLPHREKDIKS